MSSSGVIETGTRTSSLETGTVTGRPPSGHRIVSIDVLRAWTMVVIMVVHVLAYHQSGRVAYFFWNYLHFGISAFVFCSGYVLSSGNSGRFDNFRGILSWYHKRIRRLYVPYVWFFVAYVVLWRLFPGLLSGFGMEASVPFFIRSLSLTGGQEYNWLVLLFVELMVLYPWLIYGKSRRVVRTALYVVGPIWIFLCSFGAIRLWVVPAVTNWISWSLVLLFSVEAREKNVGGSAYFRWFLVSGLAFLGSSVLFGNGRELVMISRKYPPDLVYFSYDVWMSLAMYLVILKTGNGLANAAVVFVSSHSYELFFVHIVVLDAILTASRKYVLLGNIPLQLGIVILGSVGLMWLWNRLLSFMGTYAGKGAS